MKKVSGLVVGMLVFAMARASADEVAVVGGTLIDGNGGIPVENSVLVIDGKRIVAVGDHSTRIPPHAKKIAAKGKFVVPGLLATGMYLTDGTSPALTILYEGRYDQVAIEAAQLALKGGVTTVFDSWGPRDPLIKARDAVNQGRVIAARLYLCGNWIGVGGPYSDDIRSRYKEAVGAPFASRIDSLWEANVGQELTRMSAEQVRQEVRKYVNSGIDFVSYLINVHRPDADRFIIFPPRVQQVIVEEAHRAGLPVQAAFVTTDEGLRMALDAGVDMIELMPWGGKPLSAETVALVAQRKIPIFTSVTPTADLEWYQQHSDTGMAQIEKIMDVDARALIGAGAQVLSAANSAVYSADQIKEIKDGSHGLPPGFDTHAQFGEGQVRGLQALQERGMKPMDALMAATRNIARVFKVDKDVGTLERGKFADLLILDRNPLENIENYRSINFVIKEGRVVDRDSLPTERLLTAQGESQSTRDGGRGRRPLPELHKTSGDSAR